MPKTTTKHQKHFERVIFTLPRPLVNQLQQFAQAVRGGNKSGFVADAIQAYITQLRKTRHTQKLRQSYAASAEDSLTIARQWQSLDEEAWAKLDDLEAKAT